MPWKGEGGIALPLNGPRGRAQRDVLGVDEDPRLEGLHDDDDITSIIMNDDPEFVRLEQRIAADKASINGIGILPADKTIEHAPAGSSTARHRWR